MATVKNDTWVRRSFRIRQSLLDRLDLVTAQERWPRYTKTGIITRGIEHELNKLDILERAHGKAQKPHR